MGSILLFLGSDDFWGSDGFWGSNGIWGDDFREEINSRVVIISGENDFLGSDNSGG